MEGIMQPEAFESVWSWTKGLRPSHAVVLEVVRLAVASFLIINLVFVAFFLSPAMVPGFSFTPHDPKYAGIAASNRELYALDQPLSTQYLVFFANAITGNLGLSYFYRAPVAGLIWTALPVTFELTIATLLWALIVGGVLGWAASSRRFPRLRTILGACGGVLYGLPVFAVLLLLLWYVQSALGTNLVWRGLSPPRVTGFYTLDALLTGDAGELWRALSTTALLTLPAGLALSLPVLHRVRKGIEARRASPQHAALPSNRGLPLAESLRAATLPLLGSVGILLPFAFAASFLGEVLGARRGVGWQVFAAMNNLDPPLLLGSLLLPSLIVLVVAAPFTLLVAFLSRTPPVQPDPIGPQESVPSVRFGEAAGNLLRSRALLFWIGVAVVAVPIGVSVAAPVVAPLGPLVRVVPVGSPCTSGIDCPLSPPSPGHPLGVDFFGLDIFAEVLWGGLYLLVTVAVAACLAVALGLVLGLLASPLGRAADLPARAILGGMAALPVIVLLWLLVLSLPLALALGFVFVPVVFRDVRDASEATARVSRGGPPGFLRLRGWSDRVNDGGLQAVRSLLVRLPRRMAEMVLLAEALRFLFAPAPSLVDWAGVISAGLNANAFVIGNPWWIGVPFLLLFLLAAGLVLVSEGLWLVFPVSERRVALAAPPPAPIQPPLFAGGNP